MALLRHVCCVLLAASSLLLLSAGGEVKVRPVLQVLVGQNSFFEWLASLVWPSNGGTTTTTPTTPAATSTELATTTTTTSEATTVAATERECVSCRCGVINTLRRIVGGQETRRHQYPWMVAVLFHGRFYCAGSLISDLYVLTAAHCVEGVPAELITLRLLEHNRSASDAAVLQRHAAHVKPHELYNPRSYNNDIALIRLDRPVSFEARVRPICMPETSGDFDGEPAIVTGWGARREGQLATDTLQEVDVVVLSQDDCRNASLSSYQPGQISDNMLCAGYAGDLPKDACSGDSGGPLHVLLDEEPGQYQLAGIVSWGEGCARPNAPGVYTRVNRYLRWIAANTAHACMCTPLADHDY
ncbi:hypothetical protein KR093_008146 [Drosophila rubida]|uniref:Peptidase S1 domain-containing protein n=1 Tax=Drosophila rubida TaxID=30044 RepID=A0AAD4K3C9_9MUSC|nr:hypothetical protein KR093_008146 [Drosophila rubida]